MTGLASEIAKARGGEEGERLGVVEKRPESKNRASSPSRPVEQRTSAPSRAMLEPRLIVRQSFLIGVTRGTHGTEREEGASIRVSLARTSADEVGRFRKTTAKGG